MFNEELTRIRLQRKLTKHELATATGLSYQHIYNLEAGHRALTLTVLRKLDRCLHFPARILVAAVRGTVPLQVVSRAMMACCAVLL